jgi:hypothetical protein
MQLDPAGLGEGHGGQEIAGSVAVDHDRTLVTPLLSVLVQFLSMRVMFAWTEIRYRFVATTRLNPRFRP